MYSFSCAEDNSFSENGKSDDTTKKTDTTNKVIPNNFIKKVLFEEFSGQDCPNCPMGYEIAKKISQKYPNFYVGVNIHAGGLSKSELRITEGQKLWDKFDIPYQPRAMINRKKNNSGAVDFLTSEWVNEFEKEINKKSFVNIIINNNITNRKIEVENILYVKKNTSKLKITSYLVENNILASQAGVSGGIYNHQHILRKILSKNYDGDDFSYSSEKDVDTVKILYSYEIPSYINLSNIEIISFVSDSQSDEIYNVRKLGF